MVKMVPISGCRGPFQVKAIPSGRLVDLQNLMPSTLHSWLRGVRLNVDASLHLRDSTALSITLRNKVVNLSAHLRVMNAMLLDFHGVVILDSPK